MLDLAHELDMYSSYFCLICVTATATATGLPVDVDEASMHFFGFMRQ